jgi:hypothetical protein
MTWEELSDDAKMLFMIWGLAARFDARSLGYIAVANERGFWGFALKEWCVATGKPAEDVRPAYEELRMFWQHCNAASNAVAEQRRKDRERMRRMTG